MLDDKSISKERKIQIKDCLEINHNFGKNYDFINNEKHEKRTKHAKNQDNNDNEKMPKIRRKIVDKIGGALQVSGIACG